MSTTPMSPTGLRELTLRGIVLGAILTVLFTAANVYLGLKLGITFATSIPAAVISMAVLKFYADSTIQENNIVQTIASAAGTLSAIIFVLPGLIMVGWWTGFPFWLSVAVIALGGILGVMYSVPLRRALVTGSDLPYPEGVAAAEVLKVGAGVGGAEENKRGLAAIVLSSLVSAAYAILAQTKLVAAEAARSFPLGAGATTVTTSLSMALIGVGHLVGLAVGIAMLFGLIISWFVLVPWQTGLAGLASAADLETLVSTTFREKVRFIGAGTIGVAALWTLLKIIGPIVSGVTSALAASRARKGGGQDSLALTERDIPIGIIGLTIVGSLIPIGLLLSAFAQSGPIAAAPGLTIGLSLLYIFVAGAIIAAITGYMAGLIGASNSPVSGVGILTVLGISLILVAIFGREIGVDASQSLVAFALFVTAIIFGVATIANDNLQDLKTGQLVGATPWRQQVALIIGVIFGTSRHSPDPHRPQRRLRLPGRAGGRAQRARRAAGGADLGHRAGRARRQPRLGPDRARRRDRRRRDHRRRNPAQDRQALASPARGRHGHLSADGADPAHPDRRDDRLFLQQVGRARAQPGLRRAARRAHGDRADRRRKPVRGRLRGNRRRDRQ